MANAAIEVGGRREPITGGVGFELGELVMAASSAFKRCWLPASKARLSRCDLVAPAHHCDREHGSEPIEAQDRAHGRFESDRLAAMGRLALQPFRPGPTREEGGWMNRFEVLDALFLNLHNQVSHFASRAGFQLV